MQPCTTNKAENKEFHDAASFALADTVNIFMKRYTEQARLTKLTNQELCVTVEDVSRKKHKTQLATHDVISYES